MWSNLLAPIQISSVAFESPVNWTAMDRETWGAWVLATDGGRFRLLVESLPEGGWDWVIWHTDDLGRGESGKASTAICAKLFAEQALMRIVREMR